MNPVTKIGRTASTAPIARRGLVDPRSSGASAPPRRGLTDSRSTGRRD